MGKRPIPTISTSRAGRPMVTRGWSASSRALSLLGGVRRTESIWDWYSGGTAWGAGATPPGPVGGLELADAPGGGVDDASVVVVVLPRGPVVPGGPGRAVVEVGPELVVVVEPGRGGTWARAAKPPATAASIRHEEGRRPRRPHRGGAFVVEGFAPGGTTSCPGGAARRHPGPPNTSQKARFAHSPS